MIPRSIVPFALAGVLVLACLDPVRAAPQAAPDTSWPHWRGPAASGVSTETGLPLRWSSTDNIAWKAPLGGLGVSTPIVWGDRVFVTSQAGRGARQPGTHPRLMQSGDAAAAGERPLAGARPDAPGGPGDRVRFLIEAFSRTDGTRLWTHEFAAEGDLPPVHDKHNLASASPVTDGERVYAVFGTGQVVAVDASGARAWSRHLAREFAPFDIQWGYGSSPVLYGDSLILICFHPSASYLLALDRRTGKPLWKTERGRGVLSYSSPIIVPTPAGDELIVNSSEGVEAYRADTGEALWRFEEANRFPIPSAVQDRGIIYLSRGYRSGPYAAIRPGGRGDVSKTHVVWHVPTGAPYVSSIVYYDGLIYMAGDVGVITCVDAMTGKRVWQERTEGVFTASPVAADGKIYLVSESGETIVLLAGRTAEVLARNQLGARMLASPAISGGRLFMRTDDQLIAIGTRAGS